MTDKLWLSRKHHLNQLHSWLGVLTVFFRKPEIQGPVAESLVSANRWLRGIKMYRFPWYLTLVSTNHASTNPGLVGKSNNLHHYMYVWEASENMDCGWPWCNFFTLVVCSADLDIVCSGSSSHHHYSFLFMHRISTQVIGVNGKYPWSWLTPCATNTFMLGWVWFIMCWLSVPVKVPVTQTRLLHAVRVASNKKCSKPKHTCKCNYIMPCFPCLAFLYKVTLHSNFEQLWLMSHKLMSQYRINIPISVNKFSTSLDYVIVV